MYDSNQMYWAQGQDGQPPQQNAMQAEFYPPASDPMYGNMNQQQPAQFLDPQFVQPPGMPLNGGFYPPQQHAPHPDPSMAAHAPSQMVFNVEQPQDSRDYDNSPSQKPNGNKKRRKKTDPKSDEGSPDEEDDSEHKAKAGFLRLPDVIDKLASEKQVLIFDNDAQLYVVKDGPGFESQFNDLRYTRGKKSEGASNRPFSRMHTYFVLVRGERWAGTGSAFKAKDAAKVVPPGDMVQAANINVTLMPSNETAGFQVTLQHFLNVTGSTSPVVLCIRHAKSSADMNYGAFRRRRHVQKSEAQDGRETREQEGPKNRRRYHLLAPNAKVGPRCPALNHLPYPSSAPLDLDLAIIGRNFPR